MAKPRRKDPSENQDSRSPSDRTKHVYVPLLVAIIAAAAAIAATVLGNQGGEAPSAKPSPRSRLALEIVDTVVVNRPPPRFDEAPGGADDVANGIGGQYDAQDTAGVILTLRNASKQVSVVNRAHVTIGDFDALSADGCIPGAGPIAISANYNAQLPPQAHPGDRVDLNLSQELRPNTADRIRIGFALDDPDATKVFDNGDGTGQSRFYVLQIDLYHDRSKTPLHTSRVLLAVPFPYYGLFAPVSSVRGDCVPHNRSVLTRMLKSRARRSPELTAFAADPTEPAARLKAVPAPAVHAGVPRSCGRVYLTLAGARSGGRVDALHVSCTPARRVIRYALTHHQGNSPLGPSGWNCARGGSPEVSRHAVECTRPRDSARARLLNP